MLENIALDRIAESPFNPRRTYDQAKLQELADSIKARGVDSPVRCRPAPGGSDLVGPLQLVYGHRRLRAARLAGLATIPGLICQMTDAEVREAQAVENAQREDVHPLEEADAYQAMIEKDGKTVQDIAAKVGKSTAYVYARLKLCALCPAAREAFTEGELTPSTALIVARIPDPDLQEKATQEIVRGYNGAPLSAAQASVMVRRDFMLVLAKAPFDRADPDLVAAAGSCLTCPKRTAAQRELFADVEDKDDLCIDPPCWKKKVDAAWEHRVGEARKAKRPVLSEKEAKKIWPYGSGHMPYSSPYIDIDAECSDDPRSRKWKTLLGKPLPITTLARDPDGGIHELLDKKQAQRLLKAAGHDFDQQRKEAAEKQKERRLERDPAAAARELEQKVRRRVAELARLRMVALIETGAWEKPETWQVAIEQMMNMGGGEEVFERRGVDMQGELPIARYCATLSRAQLLGLVFELCADDLFRVYNDYPHDFAPAMKVFGLGLQELEAAARAELAPAAASASAKEVKKGKGSTEPEPAAKPAGKKGKAAAPAQEEPLAAPAEKKATGKKKGKGADTSFTF